MSLAWRRLVVVLAFLSVLDWALTLWASRTVAGFVELQPAAFGVFESGGLAVWGLLVVKASSVAGVLFVGRVLEVSSSGGVAARAYRGLVAGWIVAFAVVDAWSVVGLRLNGVF